MVTHTYTMKILALFELKDKTGSVNFRLQNYFEITSQLVLMAEFCEMAMIQKLRCQQIMRLSSEKQGHKISYIKENSRFGR